MILFYFQSGVKCVGQTGWRLAHARQVHRDVCSLLSAASDSLRQTIQRFSQELPDGDKATNNKGSGREGGRDNQLTTLLHQALETMECEEDFVASANSNIGRLCSETVFLWRQLLDRFTGCEPIRVLLAQQHHTYRVKRFAEAFYFVNHPRQSISKCNDADVHTYSYVAESLRKSR